MAYGDHLKTRFANEKNRTLKGINYGIKYDTPTDGLFQVKWPNGNLRYEWYYKDGKRADGVSKGWFRNGQLKQTITWESNIAIHTTGYYYSGQKKWEGPLKKDREMDGLWTSWYPDGQKEFERIYKEGEWIK